MSNQVFQLPLCSWLLGVEHHELHRMVAQPTAENHKLHHRAVPVRDTALVSRFEQMALLREAGPLQPLLLLLLPPVQLMLLLHLPLLLRVLWAPVHAVALQQTATTQLQARESCLANRQQRPIS